MRWVPIIFVVVVRAVTHRMNRVAEHGDVAFAPALQHRRSAVIEIPLLDDLLGSVVKAGVNLLRPAFELLS
jgi:hypothetical protein